MLPGREHTNTRILMKQGENSLQQGNYEKAQECYLKVLENEPENLDALCQLSSTFYYQGFANQALDCLLIAFQYDMRNKVILSRFANCAATIRLAKYPDNFDKALYACFRSKAIDQQKIVTVTIDYLKSKYRNTWKTIKGLSHPIFNDKLFHILLNTTVNTDVDFELLLKSARNELLARYENKGAFTRAHIHALLTVAMQNILNGYIYPLSTYQSSIVRRLRENIDMDKAADLLVYGMLAPINTIPNWHQIKIDSLIKKNRIMTNFLRVSIVEPILLQEISTRISSYRKRPSEISSNLESYYDNNPYPQWHSLSVSLKNNLFHILGQRFSGFNLAKQFLSKYTILIVGCGTGKQVIQTALANPRAEVFAVDVSRQSLAYAVRMAKHYRVSNVGFLQADILDLKDFDKKRFNYIEAIGVLQQLSDPKAGMEILTQILTEKGMIRFGFAKDVSQRLEQSVLTSHDPTMSLTQLQHLRETMLQDKQYAELLSLDKFFCSSGFREMLLKWARGHYDLGQISNLLDDLPLRFLGFSDVSEMLKQDYLRKYPGDKTLTDLKCWQQLESSYTSLFPNMYDFYCQKVD